MKKDLTHHVTAAHTALLAAGLANVPEARKHLVDLENHGIETKDADDALDTHEKLVQDDPSDTEAHQESWEQFTDALLNLSANEVEVPDEEETPATGEAPADTTPSGIAEDGSEKPDATPEQEGEGKVDSKEVAKLKKPQAPKWPTPETAKERLDQHVARFPMLPPEVAFHVMLDYDPEKFGQDKPYGIPRIPQDLSYLPYPRLGGWTPEQQPTEFKNIAGYEYLKMIADDMGLVFIHNGNQQRVHEVKENPDKLGWITFYAGTAKRNATINSLCRNCVFADAASAPPIPDITKPAPAEPGTRAKRGSGAAAPPMPPIPEGPKADWKWDEETFTGVADEKYQIVLTASGAHVWGEWQFIGDGEKPEISEGKVRMKSTTRQKAMEEIEKRYARGEFNG